VAMATTPSFFMISFSFSEIIVCSSCCLGCYCAERKGHWLGWSAAESPSSAASG
jgi:hypothetical protein